MRKNFIVISIFFISNFFLTIKNINAEIKKLKIKKALIREVFYWKKVNTFKNKSEILWEKYEDNFQIK